MHKNATAQRHFIIMAYETRDIKLETIRRAVEEANKYCLPALKEAIIIECSKHWGLRRQSAMELINELVYQQAIVIDGNDVWLFDRYEKIKDARSLDFLGMKDINEQNYQYQLKHLLTLMLIVGVLWL